MEEVQQPIADLKNMSEVINKVVKDGYKYNFKAIEEGLQCQETEEIFKPDDVTIVNFFRFEGMSDPEDNSILYVIETNNGTKGTLVDAYGAYADEFINEFIKEVDELTKKNATAD